MVNAIGSRSKDKMDTFCVIFGDDVARRVLRTKSGGLRSGDTAHRGPGGSPGAD